MAYDKNWLVKERLKLYRQQVKNLTHLHDTERKHLLCGQGFYNGVSIVCFPSAASLPTCRQCRERFLVSIGVDWNPANGFPWDHPYNFKNN